MSALSPEQARIWDAKVTKLLTKKSRWVGGIEDMQVPGPEGQIPVRLYKASSTASELLIYFHGGGWVLGNLDAVEYPCRLLATGTGRIVVSVDYRLAPEHKFPAGPEDCYAVTKWVAENASKLGAKSGRLVVCGDSAGGNLAAVVSLMAQDRQTPHITNQVLIYPVTDLANENYESYPDELSPALTRSDMTWFIDHYLSRKEDSQNQYASPVLRARFANLPHALIITAEYDILTRQCNAYADKLRNAGVKVNIAHYPGLVHGFFTLPDAFDAAHDAISRIARELSSD